jgi:hypothetical protein
MGSGKQQKAVKGRNSDVFSPNFHQESVKHSLKNAVRRCGVGTTRLSLRELMIENPCVGGSIPPRATKDIPYRTPTHAGWRFCFGDPQSSCPGHFRDGSLVVFHGPSPPCSIFGCPFSGVDDCLKLTPLE